MVWITQHHPGGGGAGGREPGQAPEHSVGEAACRDHHADRTAGKPEHGLSGWSHRAEHGLAGLLSQLVEHRLPAHSPYRGRDQVPVSHGHAAGCDNRVARTEEIGQGGFEGRERVVGSGGRHQRDPRRGAEQAAQHGAGGLGSSAAVYLAVAGVGELRICDSDAPELSNLNRQILHDASRLGTNKATSAEQTLRSLNPTVHVTPLSARIEPDNVDELVGDAAIMVDCLDNFRTRYLLNDVAVRRGIP